MSRFDAIGQLEPPFYLVDLERLRARHAAIHEAFRSRFDRVVLGYSYKTNYLPCVLRTLHAQGAWAEVVSDLEFALALRLGVPGSQIVYNGPIKSDESIARALGLGSLLHVDSLEEASRVAEQVRSLGLEGARVGLRVNVPHPEGEGHRRFSRFGLTMKDLERAAEMLAVVGSPPVGLHAHLATKARSLEHFEGLTAAIGEAAKRVDPEHLEWIDVGGGFGFTPEGFPGRDYPSFGEYAERIHATLASVHPALVEKTLVIEPGMAMVNDAVRFVTRVESVKHVGGRRIAFVDGSIHTVKPTRHAMNLPTRVFDAAGREKRGDESPCDLVGYTCMDDDYIAIDQALPPLDPGDRVEIANVGAYTLVFKPPFIRARPAVYAQDGDRLTEDLPEESFEAFFADFDLEPAR